MRPESKRRRNVGENFYTLAWLPGSQAPAWELLFLKLCFISRSGASVFKVPKQSLGTSKQNNKKML
ncbi:MAG: hypothetical protein D3922_04630 [Candidatus Electrothrix sp. AR1]|nr:hypothetical protein [Candidatus Electrothrix sp. AR1]